MSDARFPEGWHDDPRVIEAGVEAAGLLALARCWAYANRWTGAVPGVVPDAVLARFAGRRVKKLVSTLHRVGLFSDQTADGWPIDGFVEGLPKYDPERAREAGRRGGQAKQTARRFATKPLTEPLSKPPSEPLPIPLGEPLTEPPGGSLDGLQTRTHAGAHARPVPRVPSEPSPSVRVPPERSFDDSLRSSSSASAPTTINAQAVVGAWIDAYRDNGAEPTRGQIGQVGKLAREMLADGNDAGLVLTAAKSAGAKGYATIDRELGPMVGRRKPETTTPFAVWAEE